MKNLFLTAAFLLMAWGLGAQGPGSDASFAEKQYPGNSTALRVTETAVAKNQNSKTSAVRTTWLANRARDNWFISFEGGVNSLISEGFRDFPIKDNYNWTGGMAIGKWFSPVWGLRISGAAGKLKGYQPDPNGLWYVGYYHHKPGSNMAGGTYVFNQPDLVRERYLDKDGNNPFSYIDVTADFMVNLKNLFTPYNPKGAFNPVFYAGMGYAITLGSKFDPFKTTKVKNTTPVDNFVLKGGLQLNFRVSDPVQVYVAAEGIFLPENFDRYVWNISTYEGAAAVKLGLTYNFNFRHFVRGEFRDPNEIAALNREINSLRNRPQVVCPPTPVCPTCPEPKPVVEKQAPVDELDPVFFLLDSYAVRDNQMSKLNQAADYLKNHPGAKLELVSYSDAKTGTAAYNMQLSKKRTDAVAKILTNQLGIDKKRLILSHKGASSQPFAENDQNRVTIFIK
jgi:outer membrane protein OmpA-like peptidoglycan-associated protein